MTNSGVPQFPQTSQELGQYRPDNSNARTSGDITRAIGNLDRAPDEIRQEITERRQEIRTQGEVRRVERDGNIRIATPRGDVDVQLPPDQPRPQVGQRVEVEIAPPPSDADNHALAQVTIRPAPQDTSVRASATPVEVEVRGEQPLPPRAEITPPPPNATPPANRFPEAGSLVRLDPVSPAQYEQLVQSQQVVTLEVAQTVLSAPPDGVALPVQNISPSAQAVVQEAFPSAPSSAPLAEALDIPQPPLRAAVSSSTALFSPPIATLIAPDGGNENTITLPILNRAQAAIAQLQNAATATPDAQIQNTIAPQDVRVGNIQLPQVTLAPPNQPTSPLPLPLPLPLSHVDYSVQNAIVNSQSAPQISGVVVAKTEGQVPIVELSVPQNTTQALTQASLNAPITAPLSPVETQTFILQFPSDALLLGSRIDVTPQAVLNTSTQAAQPSALSQALPVLPFANIAFPQAWPAFQDINQALMQSTAQNAAQTAQAFSNVIPSPANATQFGPAALLFVAAVRGGDLGSWLSDKASDALRSAGKGSLLSRISSEASGLSRAADAPSGEWRGMNIPLMWEGDIQKIALHYRHDSAGDSDGDQAAGNHGTRFIFDLNLDVMGKVQLDGFFRPVSADGARLDIVLRTEERFSSAMQAEMRRVYMDAIKPSQVGGELSFQDGTDAWVMIDAEADSALGVNA